MCSNPERAVVGTRPEARFPICGAAFVDFCATLPTLVEAATASRLSLVRQPQRGESDSRQADAEFLQRPAPRDGLGQALGQFIEFVVHNLPFVLVYW